jgi:hypothetical protein
MKGSVVHNTMISKLDGGDNWKWFLFFLFLRVASCCVYRYWLFRVPSIATETFLMYYILFLWHTHYTFRPLRAIFRWIIYTSYFIRRYFSTTDTATDNFECVIFCSYYIHTTRFGPYGPSTWRWPVGVETCCAYVIGIKYRKKTNSMVWVRERTIPTERPPLLGEVVANFCG